VVLNISGFGSLLNQKVKKSFRLIYQKSEICLLQRFLSNIVEEFGHHPVSTYGGAWYPQACRFLNMDHHIHSPFEKSIIERTMQYIKDRTEGFDDYFPCGKNRCTLNHMRQWLNLSIDQYNKEIIS
jgi:putative transposase